MIRYENQHFYCILLIVYNFVSDYMSICFIIEVKPCSFSQAALAATDRTCLYLCRQAGKLLPTHLLPSEMMAQLLPSTIITQPSSAWSQRWHHHDYHDNHQQHQRQHHRHRYGVQHVSLSCLQIWLIKCLLIATMMMLSSILTLNMVHAIPSPSTTSPSLTCSDYCAQLSKIHPSRSCAFVLMFVAINSVAMWSERTICITIIM